MGFVHIQTYILGSEDGASLKAAGWSFEAYTEGGAWLGTYNGTDERLNLGPLEPKQRWGKVLQPRTYREAKVAEVAS